MPSAVDILVRLRTATSSGLIDLHVALRGLERDAQAGERALTNLRAGLISLAPAAIPVAAGLSAALAPLAARLGASAVAAGAFAAAIVPQVQALGDAAKAQQKYTQQVALHGPASKQALSAQQALTTGLEGMPPATQKAAAALANLSDAYKGWSDSLAGSTMPVAVKSFAVLEALLPRLTPLVTGASTQFDRIVTALGGLAVSPGMDRLSAKFTTFANNSLRQVTDDVLHFTRIITTGDYNKGPLHDFMAYAKANAPLARETLKNLVEALANLGHAAADAGPGMLTIVNALAKLINAVPAPVLTRVLQLYTALKLLKTTSAGITIVGGALGEMTRELGRMTAASAAAGGGLAGVRAALGTLSTGTKVAGVVAVIAGVVLALKSLSGSGKAAPDVAKMTTALGELGRTGKVSGEAARVLGGDLGDLNKAVERLNGGGSSMDHFNDTMNKIFTLGLSKSNSAKQAAKDVDAVDKALADLVQNGNPDLAAAALKRLTDEYSKTGKPTSDLTSKLDDYKSALADAKFQQDLTADSQGLFGQQAEATQKTLDAQKASADGLRQSLQALNDVNRKGIDGMIGMEQAIADGSKSLKDNGAALSMVNGQLVLTSQKARDEATALEDVASKTDDATAAAREQGKSWQDVAQIYDRGRGKLIDLADKMGLTRDQAKQLADQILKTPDKTAFLKGNMQDLQAKVTAAKAQLKTVPASKTAALKANIAQLENAVRDAQAEIARVQGKTVVIRSTYVSGTGNVFHEGGGYADGGRVSGPGTGTSDSILIRASDGEFVVNAAAAKKNLPLLEAINSGKHGIGAFARGGKVSKAQQAAAAQRQAEQQARDQAMGAFGVSFFGRVAGYSATPFERDTAGAASLGDLVNTLNQWRSTIAAATHGVEEAKLEKALTSFGANMIKNERALTSVNSQLTSAKDKLASLKDSFNQLKDSVSSSVVAYGSIAKNPAPNALGVVEQLQGSVNDAKRFAADLARLKKAGLNSQSLSELAQAGVEGGLSTADALAGASPAYLKKINALEKQLQAAGGSAGATAADSMYGAGIKAADGLVKGLEKRQKQIETVMVRAADAMARELKRALGAKAKASGGVVGAAATGGNRWGRTLVGEYAPELVDLPVGSRVHSGPDTARMLAAGSGGSSEPLSITLIVGDATLGEVLVDPLRKAVRTRGGNVQAVLGVRGK